MKRILFLNTWLFSASYPEIGNTNFKGALWTFKQQLALKILPLHSLTNLFALSILGYDETYFHF